MRTHCKNGHELTPENSRTKYRRGRPWVACVACVREADRRYNASELGRQNSRRTRAALSPAVERAYNKINIRVRYGTLVRQPCIECGATPTDAHHPHGYEGDAALDIEWLCRAHHAARHRKVVAA